MEIFLILFLLCIIPFYYYKGIKKGVKSVLDNLQIHGKISIRDKEKYLEDSFITIIFMK